MPSIGIRELRAGLATAVRRAGDGERLVVTVGGEAVAVLGPVDPVPGQPTLTDLAAAGLVVPPRRHDRPTAHDPIDVPVDIRLDKVLDDLRGA